MACLIGTLSNIVATCDTDPQGSCLCVVGVIISIISHTAFLPGLTEPNKTVCAVVGYNDVLRSNPHRFSRTFGKQSCMVTLRNLIRITWMSRNLGHQADQSVLAQLN